ncbi:MAG: hypothetical protein ACR2ID_04475 [Chthoniobacterales bacterium]
MKLIALALLAVATVMFVSACADENAQYSQSQLAAQHSGYDPSGHLSHTRY